MDNRYHLADMKQNNKAIQKLTELENEMGKEIGGDVVLIAYKKDDEESRH
ncbi:MAG: hypothetical protein ACOZCL_00370 [Bacillota bacterium]